MLRPPQQSDRNFIFDSWLKSYKESYEGKRIPSKIYFKIFQPELERIIEKSQVCVACDPEDHDQIYAYVVYEYIDDILCIHWAFTKHTFRRLGIMNDLIKQINVSNNPILCTYIGINYDALKNKYNLIYNPGLR